MEYHLQIMAEPARLAEARHFVAASAAALGAPAAAVDDLVLAVDEWLANVIEHGYAGQAGLIDITIQAADLPRPADLPPTGVQVRVRDAAPLFDPLTLASPDLTLPLEQRPVGGLGVYLMRRLVDALSHAVSPQGGNEVSFLKRWAGAADGADIQGATA